MYATSLKSFQDQVNAYHNQFGLDIIVSEFACYSWDGSNPQTTPQQASAFMGGPKWRAIADYSFGDRLDERGFLDPVGW